MQKAASKVETVTLKDLAASLAESHSLPKVQVNTVLTEMVASFRKHLKKGSRIRISGLGILQVRKWAARMGRNPAPYRLYDVLRMTHDGVCSNPSSALRTPSAKAAPHLDFAT